MELNLHGDPLLMCCSPLLDSFTGLAKASSRYNRDISEVSALLWDLFDTKLTRKSGRVKTGCPMCRLCFSMVCLCGMNVTTPRGIRESFNLCTIFEYAIKEP
jgi:hypothetical protein